MNLTDEHINGRIAIIADTIEEAYVCIDAAARFVSYLMDDRNDEKLPDLEVALSDAKVWVDTGVENLTLLKKELEK